MSVVIYCFPSPKIESRYSGWRNLLILNDNRLRGNIDGNIFDENLSRFPKSESDLLGIDVPSLLQRIRKLGPIWVRWSGRGDRYELLMREFLLRSLALAEQLKSNGVKVAIFHTAINHHIDSSIVQLACSIAKIPQIFLYHEPVGNRLLPMIQMNDVYDRRPLGYSVSNYDAGLDIEKFRCGVMNNKPPEYNYRSVQRDKIFALNYTRSCWTDFKVMVRSFISLRNQSSISLEQFAVTSYIGQFQSQALEQRRALRLYDSLALDFEQMKTHIGKLKDIYIIAAHHQPEATSFPEGGNYDNHVDIVLQLRSSGHNGAIIYKEHPTIWNYSEGRIFSRVAVSRSMEYYEALRALGVIFINKNVSLQEISNYLPEARFITITGSIALERAFRSQRTLVVGQPWYKGIPFVVQINGHEDWRTLSSRWPVHAGSTIIENERVEEFLRCLLSNNTMMNVTGVGILESERSQYKIDKGLQEHDQLLKFLINKYI